MSGWGPPEMMAVAMARLVRDGAITFVGVNSPLPLVAVSLARRLHAPNCIFIGISGGIDPHPPRLVPATSSAALGLGSASIFDNQELYGLNGRGLIDTSFLGFGQIDAEARVNSSFIGDPRRPKVRLPGGGGAAAIVPKSKRVILWRAGHSPRIFVDKVGFVTSAGNIDRVVTPLCVFRKEDGRLVLDSIHPYVTRDELARSTGFDIPHLDGAPSTAEPTAHELETLADIDPDGVRLSEFGPM